MIRRANLDKKDKMSRFAYFFSVIEYYLIPCVNPIKHNIYYR